MHKIKPRFKFVNDKVKYHYSWKKVKYYLNLVRNGNLKTISHFSIF